jgi:aquaporin Z
MFDVPPGPPSKSGETPDREKRGGSFLPLCLSELVGTAILVLAGVSIVIIDFGAGSPIVSVVPSPGIRRAATGMLFGTIGALIAVSPVGKHSGAHINPVVTLAFWLAGNIRARHAAAYVAAQMAGASVGAVSLLLWGHMGRSVQFGATVPGADYGPAWALLGEAASTFALVAGLFFFLSHHRIRSFTPLLFPFLYALMVYLEAPVSGTSTNPARSFGPALVSADWLGWWVYWVGPAVGAAAAVGIHKLRLLSRFEIEAAKIYHFEHDPSHALRYRRWLDRR